MGLTTRKLQSQLTIGEQPHHFEVLNIDGKRYCQCGIEDDAKTICKMNSGFTYHKVYLPESPKTVNVPHIRLDDDFQLPAQQILSQSDLEPFIV